MCLGGRGRLRDEDGAWRRGRGRMENVRVAGR